MLKIDLDHAKFYYEMIMLGDLQLLKGILQNMGLTDIGYPHTFKLFRG